MAAGSAENLASPVILRKIDKLRENNVGQHIPLPQLVAVGDQSSGKSSLLESLTGIPFPRNLELCTRYATQITSRRDAVFRIEVSIIPGPSADENHRQDLLKYRPSISSTRDLRKEFPSILAEVNMRMGIADSVASSTGKVFSDDVLKIEICGPDEDYLTVIDVPGIFRTPTEGITTKQDVKLVEKMVRGYIKNARTVILAVLPSNVDAATQEILSFAEEYDKSGERTLAILTKPDLVTERSAQEVVCSLALGRRRPLTLGYHIIRNRGADDTEDFSHAAAEAMFDHEPWNGVPKNQVGLSSLKSRLGELLGDITKKEFPNLRNDITQELQTCQRQIEALGPARQMEQEQRIFLSGIAKQFQHVASAALNAQYSADSVFEQHKYLRLITYSVNLAEVFGHDFDKRAHKYSFDETLSTALDEDDESEVNSEEEGVESNMEQAREFTNDIHIEDSPILENLFVYTEYEKPRKGVMNWIESLYINSRGRDLGVFGGDILSSAFKEQSSKWPDVTTQYVGEMIVVVHRFVVELLEKICMDSNVRNEIWAEIQDELMERYKFAIDQARFLVDIERNKRPYTLNHYFNENLQLARNTRKIKKLGAKARRERTDSYSGKAGNLVVDLDAIKTAESRSNLQQTKEEIFDILKSYYKVARKRFVDNVFSQAVDHCLLTGPKSPLNVLSQEWVIMLDTERLSKIAGENSAARVQREALQKKVRELQTAIQILKR